MADEESNTRTTGIAQPVVPMILAEQVLALFEQSGSTTREQNAALDIVRTVVLERMYSVDETTAYKSSADS